MRALITGATGFVGAHLTALLLRHGDVVLGVSRSARWRSSIEVYPELAASEVMRWDIRKPAGKRLRETVKEFRPDVVFHLAAISIPADCGAGEPTEVAFQTNVVGTRNVLSLAECCPQPVRFLQASSCHVYGTPTSDNAIVAEDADLRPEKGYGITKQAAEQLVLEATRDSDLQGVVLRGFQQTGPLQSDRMLLPEWTRQFAERATTIQVRALETTLDLMDVRDSVRAYREIAMAALESNRCIGQCINVGTGEKHSGFEIIEALREITGSQSPVVESSPGPRRNPIANVRRMDELIQFKPQHPLVGTVADTYAYWQKRLGV